MSKKFEVHKRYKLYVTEEHNIASLKYAFTMEHAGDTGADEWQLQRHRDFKFGQAKNKKARDESTLKRPKGTDKHCLEVQEGPGLSTGRGTWASMRGSKLPPEMSLTKCAPAATASRATSA